MYATLRFLRFGRTSIRCVGPAPTVGVDDYAANYTANY